MSYESEIEKMFDICEVPPIERTLYWTLKTGRERDDFWKSYIMSISEFGQEIMFELASRSDVNHEEADES